MDEKLLKAGTIVKNTSNGNYGIIVEYGKKSINDDRYCIINYPRVNVELGYNIPDDLDMIELADIQDTEIERLKAFLKNDDIYDVITLYSYILETFKEGETYSQKYHKEKTLKDMLNWYYKDKSPSELIYMTLNKATKPFLYLPHQKCYLYLIKIPA